MVRVYISPRDPFAESVVWTEIALLVTYYKLVMGLENYNTQLVKVYNFQKSGNIQCKKLNFLSTRQQISINVGPTKRSEIVKKNTAVFYRGQI